MKYHRLTEEEIDEIILLYKGGARKPVLAKKFGVDPGTIGYHTKGIILLKKVDDFSEKLLRERQSLCKHPSFKCSCCGLYQDNLRREDYEIIRSLHNRVIYLEDLLRTEKIPFGK